AEAGFGLIPDSDGSFTVTTAPDGSPVEAAALNRFLAGHGFYAAELVRVQANLEQIFLRLTAGDALGEQPGRRDPEVPR
ncbi:MAG: ABC transporter ATP-binding protein, partial [Microlunatus sp.]|nr:ABC transporter ATP-binding protein [Microlunatus sp.]